MQSLRRQLKRGNAVFCIDSVNKIIDVVPKRGAGRERFMVSVKNRATVSEEVYMNAVTMPLSHDEIFNSDSRFVFKRPSVKSGV